MHFSRFCKSHFQDTHGLGKGGSVEKSGCRWPPPTSESDDYWLDSEPPFLVVAPVSDIQHEGRGYEGWLQFLLTVSQ